jgi:hypothetical protein
MMYSSFETYKNIRYVPKCNIHGCMCKEDTKICKKCLENKE